MSIDLRATDIDHLGPSLELVGAENAAGGLDLMYRAACEHGGSGAFRGDDVGIRCGNDFVARTAMHCQGDLIAHGPGRQEDRRLLAEKLRYSLIQKIDRRVLVTLLVPHHGVGNRVSHGRARLGRRIADKINGEGRSGVARHAGTALFASLKPSQATSSAKSISQNAMIDAMETSAALPNFFIASFRGVQET